MHHTEPEWIEEQQLVLPALRVPGATARPVRARPDFVLPAFRYNEARSFIAGGLQDFSISRAGQPWGVPIPWDPDQVALRLGRRTRQLPERADLRAARRGSARPVLAVGPAPARQGHPPLPLRLSGPRCCSPRATSVPHQLFVHGCLLLDDRKISKSLGNVVDPLDLVDVYGADPVRFWCDARVSFGQDGTASLEGLHERYERELANDLGNLVSRTTAMVARFLDGDLPDVRRAPTRRRARSWSGLGRRRRGPARRLRPHRRARADLGGRPQTQPTRRDPGTVAAREGRDAARRARHATLYDLADGLRVVAIALARIRPGHLRADPRGTRRAMRPRSAWERVAYGLTGAKSGIAAAAPLFPRIDSPHRHGVTGLARAPRRVRGRCRRPSSSGRARPASRGSSPSEPGSTRAAPRSRSPRRTTASTRRSGSIRIRRRRRRRARIDELRELLAHPKAVAVGETGLDTVRRHATPAEQRRLLDAHLELADELELPVVIHNREADAETASALAAFRGTVVLHCFSSAELVPVAVERGYYVSFAGNVTYPNAAALRAAATHDRARPHPRRDRQPVPRAAAAPRTTERAGERRPHAARPGRGAWRVLR